MSSAVSQTSSNKRKRPSRDDLAKRASISPERRTTKKPALLRIITDVTSLHKHTSPSEEPSGAVSDTDSLFDDSSDSSAKVESHNAFPSSPKAPIRVSESPNHNSTPIPASRSAPLIPGLFFDPTLRLSEGLAEEVMWTCIRTYFQSSDADQVMLFERAGSPDAHSGLPPILNTLLAALAPLLRPLVPPSVHALLFPPSPTPFARQAILNLYWPGDGITPHVDLLDRYGDGIVGVSFGSGCVMQFTRVRHGRGDEPASERAQDIDREDDERVGVFLPAGSMIVLTEEARYNWTHGIEKCMEDFVEREASGDFEGKREGLDRPARWIPRDVRLSVTFRWLLPGADIVGHSG